MEMSAIQNFEPRKFTMSEPQQSPPQQLQQQLNAFKAQPLSSPIPRVIEYTPHFGPEGQSFTVSLQAVGEKSYRVGFGTLVVHTKQYSANGYVTLSCTVPSLSETKWFVPKVPLYVLQMENDMVLESWGFGDYSYYEDVNSSSGSATPTASNYNSNNALAINTTLAQSKRANPQASPLMSNVPRDDDYANLTPTSSSYDSLYSPSQTSSPYGNRPPMNVSYNRTGYYNTNQIAAPHNMSAYSQSDLAVPSYAMNSTANHNSGYVHSNYNSQQQQHQTQSVAAAAYMPHPNFASIGAMHGMANSHAQHQNPYSSLLNKASLKTTGNMDDMAINWSGEEWESHRRLVQFWRRQDGNEIQCNFAPVAPADRQPNSIVVSCIYWAERNDCFLTSVDCIYLLESLIAVRFTVEEKNRIRRNLEGFRPITVSKCKPESAEFFKLIMSFPNPKPRNIEKDVKVFPWKVLAYALKKIIGKYTASYSSTASIQTDAFHNANFPHGSTLPITPQQQTILESSVIV
ncbi:hypothetical protein BG004_000571 [Podila humilis]|nr:hypothetical protein BG004_000571 [Podila humilis]